MHVISTPGSQRRMKKEHDFSKSKRGPVVREPGKTRITIYLDKDLLEAFRERADAAGRGYQGMINEALREHLGRRTGRPRARRVEVTADELRVDLADGRRLGVPLVWFPRLVAATAEARAKFELLGDGEGIHSPDADEDISVAGLLVGAPSAGLRPRAA
jgi:uncharacterized protein (DUF4415 family)